MLRSATGSSTGAIVHGLELFAVSKLHRPSQWSAGAMKSDDPSTSLPPDRSAGGPAGIWVQHGSTQDLLKQTFVKGGDVTIAAGAVDTAAAPRTLRGGAHGGWKQGLYGTAHTAI